MKALDPLTMVPTGTNLIEASAGTGKTHTITTLFVRLVAELGLEAERILVVTFTEAATAELRDRIRSRLRTAHTLLVHGAAGDPQLEQLLLQLDRPRARTRIETALRTFDQAPISTIHGFCSRMLTEHAFESGVAFDSELVTDQSALMSQAVSDFWASQIYQAPDEFVRFIQSQKIDHRSLLKHLSRPISQRLRDLVPGPGSAASAVEEYQQAYAQMREHFAGKGEAIGQLLLGHDGLNRRSYSKGLLAGWLGQMETYLEPAQPRGNPPPEAIKRFTTPMLAKWTKPGFDPPVHPFFPACNRLVQVGAAFKSRLVVESRKLLDAAKSEHNLRTFDDLLYQMDAALEGPGGDRLAASIRDRYRAALIDEFQDTDPVQYRIFDRIYSDQTKPLFLIGDPKQSIYAFRGADIFAYLQAAGRAGDRRYTLGCNYRSDPGLIAGFNFLFQSHPNPFLYTGISYSPVDSPEGRSDVVHQDGDAVAGLQFRYLASDSIQGQKDPINKGKAIGFLPDRIAADISKLLDGRTTLQLEEDGSPSPRGVRPGDVAVLTRTNAQAKLIQAALRSLRIPSVLTSDASVFQTVEAEELRDFMLAVAESTSASGIRSALSTVLMGQSAHDLIDLQQDERSWEAWIERFRSWHERWSRSGFIQMFRAVLDFRPTSDSPRTQTRLLGLQDGERRMTNLLHLAELLHTTASEGHLGPAGLLRWLEIQMAQPDNSSDAAQLRLESDAQAVQLTTIHKSKGLQYRVVYCPFLWSGLSQDNKHHPLLFHDPDQAQRPKLDLGSIHREEHRRLADRETMAENLRLLYVAVTRAKHLCVVIVGEFAGFETSPLGHLVCLPEGDSSQDATIARCKKLVQSKDLRQVFARLAENSSGTIDVQDLTMEDGREHRPEEPPSAALECLPIDRKEIKRRWKLDSFSSIASSGRRMDPDEEAGRDLDQHQEGPWERAPLSGEAEERIPLADFERGARAGRFFHAVFENLDFAARDRPALEDLVGRQLRAHGLPVDDNRAPAASGVEATLETVLDPARPECRLRAIRKDQRLDELEFFFPVNCPKAAEGLAEVLRKHGEEPIPADYPDRVAALDLSLLRGFLRGFIDLVWKEDDRWYLLDYKTNHLGDRPSDYAFEHLQRAMASKDYILQSLIYGVALHRYLGLRLPGYDYDQHFGGAHYLFLRGMGPNRPPGHGVFSHRPSRNLMEALEAHLVGSAPGRPGP